MTGPARTRRDELYASLMPRSPRWYVMAVMVGREDTAIQHLERQGYSPCIPMLVDSVVDRHTQKLVEVRRPRFQGYGFIWLDLEQDEWGPVKSTRGVRHLLPRFADRPSPLPVGFVERIQAEPEKIEQIIEEFATDDLVHFVRTSLVDQQARVIRQEGKAVQVCFPNGATHWTTVEAIERDA